MQRRDSQLDGAFFLSEIHLQKWIPKCGWMFWREHAIPCIYTVYIFFYYTIIVLIGGTNNIQCIVKYSGYNYISRWWFQTFFIFAYIWNSNPNWLSYFSEGLKPPTRYIYIYIVHILYKHVPLVGYPHPVVQAPMGTAFDLKLPPLGATLARGF